ncbi:MAG: hypothetical protein ACE145_08350 [Terriglobia bacterium]
MSQSSDFSDPGKPIPDTGVENPAPKSDADPTRCGRSNAFPTRQIDSRTSTPPSTPEDARRCEEKGCIFPVAGPGRHRCLNHDRAENEPEHFECSQPTVLMLDQARFGLPDPETEPDDSRFRDRRREMTEREAFFEEAA